MGRVKRVRMRKKREKSAENQNFHQKFVPLLKFMKENGWENDTKLKFKTFESTGDGIFSVRGIKSDEELIKVPFQAMITLETLISSSDFAKKCENTLKDTKFTFQCLLSLFLVHERSKGDFSRWKSYLDVIPHEFSVPYFCTKDEFHHLDENLLQKMVKQKEIVKKSCEIFQKFDFLDKKTFEWAFFVVNTRGVYLDSSHMSKKFFGEMLEDSPNIALVPFLDFFNHSDDVRTSTNANHDFYSLRTHVPHKKFSQIFISYGNHNNFKLLLEYGFTLEQNSQNYVEITLNDISNLIKHDPELRSTQIPRPTFQFITQHNLDDQLFVHSMDGLSHNLKVVLFMIFIEKNVHNLYQIAFGNALDEEKVVKFGQKLINWKTFEFNKLKNGLMALKDLSLSGKQCLKYYGEELRYLEECKNVIN